MTPEEAAQLKTGDLIFINNFPVTFKKINNTVIICFEEFGGHDITKNFEHCAYFSKEEYVPAPRYSSSRLFRERDEVKIVERNGRFPYSFLKNTKLFVRISEDDYGMVGLHEKGGDKLIKIHYSNLELVTPREELEPYSVEFDEGGHYVCDKDGTVISLYYNNLHPNAKAAAEAERDRLNAEHRKERKNA